MLDRNRKLPLYAREGVGHLWLVDPVAQTVEVYILADSYTQPAMTVVGKVILNLSPFESTGIDLGQVFG